MSLLSLLSDLFGRSNETDAPVYVVQYGSTKSYTFRREVLRDNFKLPIVADQATLVNVLHALRQFYLKDISQEDFDTLNQMLIYMDDVILAGLKNPREWVLPQGFSEIPFVKSRLDKNYSITQIIEYIFCSTRCYIWMYRDDEAVSELVPHLLELEESYEPLRTQLSSGQEGSIRAGIVPSSSREDEVPEPPRHR
jgi:hypothetical protein